MTRSCIHRLPFGFCLVLAASTALALDRTVTVSGSGTVKVPPDEVAIDLQLSTVDDDLVRVRADSDKQVKAILELGQKHGVQEDDLEVRGLKMGLSYNEQLKRQIYHVDRSMSVTLDKLENLNALLAELLEQPDAKVEQVRFGVSRAEEHELEARRRAVASAKATAENLAELNGLKLGKAVRIQTYQEHSRPFVTSVVPVVGQADPFGTPRLNRNGPTVVRRSGPAADQSGGFVAAFLAVQAAGDSGAEGDNAAFGLGHIQFEANVSIVFELLE